jgi:peptide/nickel transport system permease protein
MLRYVSDRLLQAALTLLILSVAVFFLSRVLGDPIAFMLPFDSLPSDIIRVRQQLGLDQPLIVQYWNWVVGVVSGDLGVSTRQQIPVLQLILDRAHASLILCGAALLWASSLSLVLGVGAAVYKDTFLDRLARVIAIVGQSAPPFWLGIVLIQLFSVRMHVLPSAGIGSWSHLVMPAFTVGLFGVAGMTRLVRSGMLEVLDSEFVKKARIMGTPEWRVIWKHALKNAAIPVLTFAGEYFGILIAAAVVVETVFAWPGIGRLAYEAVFTRDYPLIQGITLTIALLVLAMNLFVDLLYLIVDPRIRYVG